jgi:hypothetical protein
MGFGRVFETLVVMTGDERVMGFVARTKSYDIHHSITVGLWLSRQACSYGK